MSNCPACTKAAESPMSGIYHSSCMECGMRGYARSSLAADALKSRRSHALRAAIEKSHPQAAVEDALALVWKWWRIDHANAEQGKA